MTEEITIDIQAAAGELLRLRRRVKQLEVYSMLLEIECGRRMVSPETEAEIRAFLSKPSDTQKDKHENT
jgi:hypothetical protein